MQTSAEIKAPVSTFLKSQPASRAPAQEQGALDGKSPNTVPIQFDHSSQIQSCLNIRNTLMSYSRARGGGSAGDGSGEHLNQSMGGDAGAVMNWEASEESLQRSRELKIEDAKAYLARVKTQYEGEPNTYIGFLDAMKEYKAQMINTNEVIGRVVELLSGHKALILGFNPFLPPGYTIEVGESAHNMLSIRFSHPHGVSELPVQQKASDDDHH